MGENKDRLMLKKCTENASNVFAKAKCAHPLDSEIIAKLKDLCEKIDKDADDFYIFRFRQDIIDPLWKELIEKAIICLRYCDEREPFKQAGEKGDEKIPKAYGIDELKEYYDKYIDFERLLYGSNRYYRDHVVHVFRTWLSGTELMVKNQGTYLDKLSLNEKEGYIELSREEKLSMWTIIALTHDLGYPLQKAKNIIDATRSMVSTFIANPDISMDLSFHGVQNYMNDFIVRLMSSKMVRYDKNSKMSDDRETANGKRTELYAARLQPKYYFKFQKSLENNSHGILSTLIIYKLLTYFLESDYSINEDYAFDSEDRRQFYIRREILRAIASHTCNDIYQLYMTSFSFLLRICDDTQEWGRKNISELYVNNSREYELKDIDLYIGDEKDSYSCTVEEEFTVGEIQEVVVLINRLREQSLTYVTIFRDGQDTVLRNFSFTRRLLIKCDKIEISIELNILQDAASKLTGTIKYNSDNETKKAYGVDFFEKINIDWKIGIQLFNRQKKKCGMIKKDDSGEITKLENYSQWALGEFSICLSK
ncbi:MAG: hypothetical protein HDR04_18125 [Lachnospiraceae bacterium]|nr:hypothetical protein [Lachnospiraceae bacterium]